VRSQAYEARCDLDELGYKGFLAYKEEGCVHTGIQAGMILSEEIMTVSKMLDTYLDSLYHRTRSQGGITRMKQKLYVAPVRGARS